MTERTTILAPIRFPLTDRSSRTLSAAGRVACERTPADLRVFHVNLYQNGNNTRIEDLTGGISLMLEGVEVSVTTRKGFLIEEVILQEAIDIGADVVVVGTDQRVLWRRTLILPAVTISVVVSPNPA